MGTKKVIYLWAAIGLMNSLEYAKYCCWLIPNVQWLLSFLFGPAASKRTMKQHAPVLGCPIFTQMSPNLLDRRYLWSPAKTVHFTKEIENLRGGNGKPRFFQFPCMKMTFWMTLNPRATLLRSWRFYRHPYQYMFIFVIFRISMLSYDMFCHSCHMSAMTYDIWY